MRYLTAELGDREEIVARTVGVNATGLNTAKDPDAILTVRWLASIILNRGKIGKYQLSPVLQT